MADYSPWSMLALQKQMQDAQAPSPLAPEGLLAMNQPMPEQEPSQVAPPRITPPRKMAVVPSSFDQPQNKQGFDEAAALGDFRKTMEQRAVDSANERKQLEAAQAKDFSGIQYADFSPLTSLVDGWTGSNFSKNYQAPQDKQQNQAVIEKLRASLDQGNTKQAEDKLGLLKYQSLEKSRMDGNDARREHNAMMSKAMGGKLSNAEERIHNNNLTAINKDPVVTALITTSNNLENAITNFEHGGATTQEFHELQQAVRSNAGIKGTSGVHERDLTQLKSLGLSADSALQFLTGDPQSVMESDPAFAKMVIKLARLEQGNKSKQIKDAIDQLERGHKSFYSQPGREGLAEDYKSTVDSARGRIKDGVQVSSGPQEGDMRSHDGKTYKVVKGAWVAQ